ncbi:MAG TPA: hypothetical protein VNG93_09770 [Candidatus Dormibacteraeota bacterium]|nr:hypothetical protein [Candidatus Dormibacteraeota bacterium]
MRRYVVNTSKEDLPEVSPIPEHDQNGAVAPGLAIVGAMTAAIEPGGDGATAHALLQVEVEDLTHD